MKLKDMSRVELELLSYTDLTEMILKENKKPMNTPSIFRTICDLLGYTDDEYASKIGDYYTSITIDKRFHLLDSGEWDLSDNHIIPLEIDEDEEESDDYGDDSDGEEYDDDNDLDISDDEDEEGASAKDIKAVIDDDLVDNDDDLVDDDDTVDDMADLSILDDDELEES